MTSFLKVHQKHQHSITEYFSCNCLKIKMAFLVPHPNMKLSYTSSKSTCCLINFSRAFSAISWNWSINFIPSSFLFLKHHLFLIPLKQILELWSDLLGQWSCQQLLLLLPLPFLTLNLIFLQPSHSSSYWLNSDHILSVMRGALLIVSA